MGVFSYVKAGKKIFDTIKSVKPIGGTRKSDQIKKSNKMLKDLDKTLEKDMSPQMRNRGEKLKEEVKKTQKEVYKSGFKKGGKVFGGGSKKKKKLKPVDKKKNPGLAKLPRKVRNKMGYMKKGGMV